MRRTTSITISFCVLLSSALPARALDLNGTDQIRAASIESPDQLPQLDVAWDAWHRRLGGAIWDRFNFFAKAAFRNSPQPLQTKLKYTITSEAKIEIQSVENSGNTLFDILAVQSVKSLDGNVELLRFPEGSTKRSVNKTAIFKVPGGPWQKFRYLLAE
jgi:hypothetical protein